MGEVNNTCTRRLIGDYFAEKHNVAEPSGVPLLEGQSWWITHYTLSTLCSETVSGLPGFY